MSAWGTWFQKPVENVGGATTTLSIIVIICHMSCINATLQFSRLRDLVHEVDQLPVESAGSDAASALPRVGGRPVSGSGGISVAGGAPVDAYRAPLLARVHLRLGLWSWTAEVRRTGE